MWCVFARFERRSTARTPSSVSVGRSSVVYGSFSGSSRWISAIERFGRVRLLVEDLRLLDEGHDFVP
jgi:hypothetical protein